MIVTNTRRVRLLIQGCSLLAGLSLPLAAAAAEGDPIFACSNRNSGNARIVNVGQECRNNERAWSWNQVGPAGAQGPQGPQGPEGPAGPPGGSVVPVRISIGSVNFEGLSGAGGDRAWDIYAFTQSVSLQAAAGGGGGAAKPQASAIGVELDTGLTTPQLYAAIASGAVLPRVTIQLSSLERSGLGAESFKVILTDVSLTLTEVKRKPLDKSLMSLSMGFAQIAWEYTPRDGMGAPGAVIPASWDARSGVSQGTRPDSVRYVVSDESDVAGADEIWANQFSHSISRATSTSGSGAGKAIPNVAALQGPVDRNVVGHFVALVSGARLPAARVRVLNPSVDELRYDFEEVQVRSLSLAAAADGTLEEAMSFDYQRIRWTSGSESQGWDFARNRRW